MKTLRKERRWICILLAIAIIISGMCFESVKADPYEGSVSVGDNTHFTTESTFLTKNTDLCTGEFLGLRDAKENILSLQRLKSAKVSPKIQMISVANLFFVFSYKFFIEKMEKMIYSSTNSLEIIIHYIHRRGDYIA